MHADDAQLVAGLREGREDAVGTLRAVLLRNLRVALSGRPSADEPFLEDVVQDALLRVLDRLDRFDGRSRFSTWATSVAIHLAMSQLRRRHWRDVSLQELTESGAGPALEGGPRPHERGERLEAAETLHAAIETALTDRQRTALLAELRGMPLVEIARQLGSNPGAVYKLTYDARKRLKERLESSGFTAEDLIPDATNPAR